MFNITVDSANTRTWSSDYLDLVEGTVLLLGEYEMRLESEEYRREHKRIAASASASMRRLSRQLAPMRAKLLRRGLGLSREETGVALSLFSLETFMYGINTVLDLAENEDPELVSWREDERVAAWYSKQSSLNLPGDLNPLAREMQMSRRDRRLAERFLRRFGKKLRRKIATGDRHDLVGCLTYLRGMINLCWDNGLRSAYAPSFLVLNDLTGRSDRSEIEAGRKVTADGILGPLFPAHLAVTTASDGENASQPSTHRFPEWLLLAMSLRELRTATGAAFQGEFRRRMHEFGYRHGHKWEVLDFNMLFDRLYLNRSVLQVAGNRNEDLSLVQRRTNQLRKTLHLEPPRSPRTR